MDDNNKIEQSTPKVFYQMVSQYRLRLMTNFHKYFDLFKALEYVDNNFMNGHLTSIYVNVVHEWAS